MVASRQNFFKAHWDWLVALGGVVALGLAAVYMFSAIGQSPEDAEAQTPGVEQSVAERDDAFRVHLALHAMEEPYREVFELRVFRELSFAQIGRIFSRTENWARVTYHRARIKLKERMEHT